METTTQANVRYMNKPDMPHVLDIERESFEFAWTEEDFLSTLRTNNCLGWVCDDGYRIRGFMVYEILCGELHVLNFAVAPWARRRGFGSQMVEKLVGKLTQQRRARIVLEVSETNLDAQCFFRAMGFEATEVIRGHYEDTVEDAYRFVYSLSGGKFE